MSKRIRYEIREYDINAKESEQILYITSVRLG